MNFVCMDCSPEEIEMTFNQLKQTGTVSDNQTFPKTSVLIGGVVHFITGHDQSH